MTSHTIRAEDKNSILCTLDRANDLIFSFSPLYLATASALLDDPVKAKRWLEMAKAQSSLPTLDELEARSEFVNLKQLDWFREYRPNSAVRKRLL